ncbi:LytTR family DNA-binding domain-containing protein [Massilia sp. BJB1822]|uniref:LytR/AlgR family response regulator transcription factor n=1 Tax=Massilia sp. BJB1822 TaxID=2744470 RepID=UPI001592E341|nr:response regulator [Massilia sp. BJB1822]NVD97738.1 response regulator [Massilia sp. BJB1822]
MKEEIRRRVLIVDDEEPGRINLRFALAAHASWEIAGECADVAQARAFLAAQTVDVVFLDIRMPHESGLALAHDLAQQPAPPLVIFVTAYDNHAMEAFRVHALDYLLKPLDDADLEKALARRRVDGAAPVGCPHRHPARLVRVAPADAGPGTRLSAPVKHPLGRPHRRRAT